MLDEVDNDCVCLMSTRQAEHDDGQYSLRSIGRVHGASDADDEVGRSVIVTNHHEVEYMKRLAVAASWLLLISAWSASSCTTKAMTVTMMPSW